MIGIGADNLPQINRVGIILVVFLKRQSNVGTVALTRRLTNLKPVDSVGYPFPSLVLTCFAGYDFNLVRHHKGRIKTQAEMADDARVGVGFVLVFFDKILGA